FRQIAQSNSGISTKTLGSSARGHAPCTCRLVDAGGRGTAVVADAAQDAIPTNRATTPCTCLAGDAGGCGTAALAEAAHDAIPTNRATTPCTCLAGDAGGWARGGVGGGPAVLSVAVG